MSKENWTIEQIVNATQTSMTLLAKYQADLVSVTNTDSDLIKELYRSESQKIAQRLTDPELQIKRRAQQKCPACYFISVFAGAAMTTSVCQNCGTQILNGSTDADILCLDCAKELHCCRHCGGQLN